MNFKTLSLVALATVTTVSSFARSPMPPLRPTAKAYLTQLEGDGRYPRPEVITSLKNGHNADVAAFQLVEDTGIRCVTTPCPSSKTTMFHVVETQRTRQGSIRYRATTDRPFILGIVAPRPGYKPRKIEVWDHSNNRVARHRYLWVVKLKGTDGLDEFGGNPEPIQD